MIEVKWNVRIYEHSKSANDRVLIVSHFGLRALFADVETRTLYTSIESIDEFTAFELSRCWDAETNWEAIMWRRMRELFLIFSCNCTHRFIVVHMKSLLTTSSKQLFLWLTRRLMQSNTDPFRYTFLTRHRACGTCFMYFAIKNKRHTQSARATKISRGVEEKWKVFFLRLIRDLIAARAMIHATLSRVRNIIMLERSSKSKKKRDEEKSDNRLTVNCITMLSLLYATERKSRAAAERWWR